MTRVEVPTYTATICVAGNVWEAETICRDYCDRVGLCVTVTVTHYCYTGGEEAGVAVGLINYGRFPAEPAAIFAKAEELANLLIDGLHQQSASIVATDKTVWLSRREQDTPFPPSTTDEGKQAREGEARSEPQHTGESSE